MGSSSLILTLALALGQANAADAADPVDDDCSLASIADIQVAAKQPGVVFSLEAKEGMFVKEDTELGRIDDRQAEAELNVKKFDFQVAEFKAVSDVSLRYAKNAAEVAKNVYDKYDKANSQGIKTVPETEMMKYKLEWQKAVLGIEKEKEEKNVNLLTSKAKSAEVDAARIVLDNCMFRAPVSGVIVKVYRSVGEWVATGDPVVRIVRVDRLKVVGNLDATQYGPSDIDGRRVTVEVQLPRGRTIQVPGKVVAVSPVVGVGGHMLPVTAEIDSPIENGQPVVRAGLKASMTVHVKEPAPAAARSEPQRPTKKTS